MWTSHPYQLGPALASWDGQPLLGALHPPPHPPHPRAVPLFLPQGGQGLCCCDAGRPQGPCLTRTMRCLGVGG